jgi:hypothetical protein
MSMISSFYRLTSYAVPSVSEEESDGASNHEDQRSGGQ